jgi:hypothetical protein
MNSTSCDHECSLVSALREVLCPTPTPVRCHFCGLPQTKVEGLIERADETKAYICFACVELCMEIMEEDRQERMPNPRHVTRRPSRDDDPVMSR